MEGLLLLALMMINGYVVYRHAKLKGKTNLIGWFIFGVFFHFIALIIVAKIKQEMSYSSSPSYKDSYEDEQYSCENANEGDEKETESAQNEIFDKDLDEAKYYAKVLDLKEPFSSQDIKKSYYKMISQYHPDKVQHLGDELKELAEEKAKLINEAYEFFSK